MSRISSPRRRRPHAPRRRVTTATLLTCITPPICCRSTPTTPGAPPRAELKARYRGLRSALIRAYLTLGATAEAIVELVALRQDLAHDDEIVEADYAEAMRLAAELGDRAMAGDLYAELVRRGPEQDDLIPGAAVRRLDHEIRDGAYPTASVLSAPPTLALSPLPRPTGAFVGRRLLMDDVTARLSDPEAAPLVTLSGAGGCGKSRLALEVAHRLAHDVHSPYGAGVVWVALDALTHATDAPAALARALGLAQAGTTSLADTLAAALGGRRLLLVVDNCEHLLPDLAALFNGVLDRCPTLQALVTSRIALELPREAVVLVPPLLTPPAPAASALTARSAPFGALVEQIGTYEAVQLFVARARAVQPDFVLTEANAAAIGDICRALDGLPLALILAVAALRVYSVAELAALLNREPGLLQAREHGDIAPDLDAAVRWSYDLLARVDPLRGAHPQRLLRRLSTFAGAWSIEEARGVCADGELPEQDIPALVRLLATHSLVEVETPEADDAVYRLLEPIRHFARRQLSTTDVEALGRRHLHWYATLAEQALPELEGAYAGVWQARLTAVEDNLRVALEWALAHGAADADAAEAGWRLAGALWRFWDNKGAWGEGRAYLRALLSMPRPAAPHAVWAQTCFAAGLLAFRQSDYTDAEAHLEASLAARRALGDGKGVAASLASLGIVAEHQGRYEEADRRYREVLEVDSNTQTRAAILGNLANLAIYQEDYAAARAFQRQSLAMERLLVVEATGARGVKPALPRSRGITISLFGLGSVALEQGHPARARARYQAALARFQEAENQWEAIMCLDALGSVMSREGQPGAAARLVGAAEARRLAMDTRMPDNQMAEYRALLEALYEAMDPAALRAALDDGRNSLFADIVAWALTLRDTVDASAAMGTALVTLTPDERELAVLVLGGNTWPGIAARLHLDTARAQAMWAATLCRAGGPDTETFARLILARTSLL